MTDHAVHRTLIEEAKKQRASPQQAPAAAAPVSDSKQDVEEVKIPAADRQAAGAAAALEDVKEDPAAARRRQVEEYWRVPASKYDAVLAQARERALAAIKGVCDSCSIIVAVASVTRCKCSLLIHRIPLLAEREGWLGIPLPAARCGHLHA